MFISLFSVIIDEAAINDGRSDGFPMFHTGSGRPVMLSMSSVRKASAVLEGEISEKGGFFVIILIL